MKEIKIPVSQEQRHFEEQAAIIVRIMAGLTAEQRTEIFNYVVLQYNAAQTTNWQYPPNTGANKTNLKKIKNIEKGIDNSQDTNYNKSTDSNKTNWTPNL